MPASGFGLGVERFILLLQELDAIPESAYNKPHLYFVAAGKGCHLAQFTLLQQIRSQLPDVRILADCTGSKFKLK